MIDASGHIRGIVAALAGACLLTVGFAVPSAAAQPGLPAAPATVVSSCSEAALRAAVAAGGQVTFTCSGTITLTSQLIIAAGQNLSLDGTGQSVTISGGGATRIFDVQGGTLALTNLTLTDGLAAGAPGGAGAAGTDGTDGTAGDGGNGGAPNGQDGQNGTGGSDAGNAQPGSAGQDGQGGAVLIATGASVSLSGVTVSSSTAQGGDGGPGGTGGLGGTGGGGGGGGEGGGTPSSGNGIKAATAGAGQPAATPAGQRIVVRPDADGANGQPCHAGDIIQGGQGGGLGGPNGQNTSSYGGLGGGGIGQTFFTVAPGTPGTGGKGGDGGNAGAGGNGGKGGAGGDGDGGAIDNAGTLTISNSVFTGDTAVGGTGEDGGDGGSAGEPGGGGTGGYTITCVLGNGFLGGAAAGRGGNAGDAAAGGDAGDGGDGGSGNGGAIENHGSLTVTGTTFTADSASGGSGGNSGAAAAGFGAQSGGAGGVGVTRGSRGRPGQPGTAGAAGTAGNGGDAGGGAIDSDGPLSMTGSTIQGSAQGGNGGNGEPGTAGTSADGGIGFFGACTTGWLSGMICGQASAGADGAAGADGGAGGNGGSADGGAVSASGSSASIGSTIFSGCSADGGSGGAGGPAAGGSPGGPGGDGAYTSGVASASEGADGGSGADGGQGGDGGEGGAARGGGIYSSGVSPDVQQTTFTGCAATGGTGAPGAGAGNGGDGANGGNGGGVNPGGTGTVAAGGNGGAAGGGGDGGHGGAGGDAKGGAAAVDNGVLQDGCDVAFTADTVNGGTGATGGTAGVAGAVGMGGTGSPPGNDGTAGTNGGTGDAGDHGKAADPEVAGGQVSGPCCLLPAASPGGGQPGPASPVAASPFEIVMSPPGGGTKVVTKATTTVTVGEPIDLSLDCVAGQPPPTGPYTWTLPAKSGYPATLQAYELVDNQEHSTATVTELTSFHDATLSFYWLSPGTRTIEVKASVNGTEMTVPATFDVVAPQGKLAATTCAAEIDTGWTYLQANGHPVKPPRLSLGFNKACLTTPGISLTGQVSLPDAGLPRGEIAVVQEVNGTIVHDIPPSKDCLTTGKQWQADGSAFLTQMTWKPHVIRATHTIEGATLGTDTVKVSAHGMAPWAGFDAPSITLRGGGTFTEDLTFRDYLMYHPDWPATASHNSGIWVALRELSWVFKASATYNTARHSWQFTQLPGNGNDKNIASMPSSVEPAFTAVAMGGPC